MACGQLVVGDGAERSGRTVHRKSSSWGERMTSDTSTIRRHNQKCGFTACWTMLKIDVV